MKVKFYVTQSGRSSVEDFLNECSDNVCADFLDAVQMLSSGMKISIPFSRNLANICLGLHELR
ncbi:MAG: hypothetical protein JXA66_01975, partial [Oligoflexia bacterium]|nr:hypothetical protein [Oligoflexia bacterium]